MDVGKFTSGVVGIAVSVIIVVSVAFPVITKAASAEGLDASVKTMLEVLPLLLVVAIVLAVIGMFITRGRE